MPEALCKATAAFGTALLSALPRYAAGRSGAPRIDEAESAVLVQMLPDMAGSPCAFSPKTRRLATAGGLALACPVNSFVRSGSRTMLRLGSGEWLIRDESGDPLDPGRDLAGSLGSTLHTLVDISHRDTGISVQGPQTEDVLGAGWQRDLSTEAFPVGTAARALFGNVEVLVLRWGETRFELEQGRSFTAHLSGIIYLAAQRLKPRVRA